MNHYLVTVNLFGQKHIAEIKADNEKHAKAQIKTLLTFDKIVKCAPGALQRLDKANKQVIDSKIEVN